MAALVSVGVVFGSNKQIQSDMAFIFLISDGYEIRNKLPFHTFSVAILNNRLICVNTNANTNIESVNNWQHWLGWEELASLAHNIVNST